MQYDTTVILDEDGSRFHSGEIDPARRSELGGEFVVDGVAFSWQARSLYGVWFVSVSSKWGSRSELTEGDASDHALHLAEQVLSAGSEPSPTAIRTRPCVT